MSGIHSFDHGGTDELRWHEVSSTLTEAKTLVLGHEVFHFGPHRDVVSQFLGMITNCFD